MIKIVPDKEGKLTQWDLNRKVIITGYEGGAEVHFASPGDDHGAYVVKLVDGQAEIPNILLTMAGTINVYVYPADRTVFATTLWVMAREKPDDYIYTETEVLSYKTLDEKIGDLAELTTTARENLVAAINEAATDATVDIVTPSAASTDTQAASAKAVWDMLGTGGSGGTTVSDLKSILTDIVTFLKAVPFDDTVVSASDLDAIQSKIDALGSSGGTVSATFSDGALAISGVTVNSATFTGGVLAIE